MNPASIQLTSIMPSSMAGCDMTYLMVTLLGTRESSPSLSPLKEVPSSSLAKGALERLVSSSQGSGELSFREVGLLVWLPAGSSIRGCSAFGPATKYVVYDAFCSKQF